jgi:endonuclease G, mitochondrial
MKNFYLLLSFLLIAVYSFAQKIDVIQKDNYTSYFNEQYKVPLYVRYGLHDGGGDCSRKGFRFKNDTPLPTATDKDYAHSGYQKGHMADAEDFAYDCTLDEETFRYYNCMPQTGNLNMGIWKSWETRIRKESQEDSLVITCGGIFDNQYIGNGVAVPKYCYKIVQSATSGTYLHILLFTNTSEATVQNITMEDLKKMLGYELIIDN